MTEKIGQAEVSIRASRLTRIPRLVADRRCTSGSAASLVKTEGHGCAGRPPGRGRPIFAVKGFLLGLRQRHGVGADSKGRWPSGSAWLDQAQVNLGPSSGVGGFAVGLLCAPTKEAGQERTRHECWAGTKKARKTA